MSSKIPPRETLVNLKKKPELQKLYAGHKVRIWSSEHGSWWREEGKGYTTELEQAGIYTFEHAWARSSPGGPEKGTTYELVDERRYRLTALMGEVCGTEIMRTWMPPNHSSRPTRTGNKSSTIRRSRSSDQHHELH